MSSPPDTKPELRGVRYSIRFAEGSEKRVQGKKIGPFGVRKINLGYQIDHLRTGTIAAVCGTQDIALKLANLLASLGVRDVDSELSALAKLPMAAHEFMRGYQNTLFTDEMVEELRQLTSPATDTPQEQPKHEP